MGHVKLKSHSRIARRLQDVALSGRAVFAKTDGETNEQLPGQIGHIAVGNYSVDCDFLGTTGDCRDYRSRLG